MSQDRLATLQAIDPAVLAEVVRQDQGSKSFEITEWNVKRLSDKGIVNPDGLFLFSGQGHDERGIKPWSVVLKILQDPGEEHDPRHLWYWKRELLVMQSGLPARLPEAVAAPRFYGAKERHNSAWIWMEHIIETTNPHWTMEQYAFAARQLGRFNGAYVTDTPLPDLPWLCKRHPRLWIETFWLDNIWDSPIVSRVLSNSIRERVMKLSDEQERFHRALDRLPQVISHFDFHRRNLLIRKGNDGKDQIVALDWAWCGYGALGSEMFFLIGVTLYLFEQAMEDASELEKTVFDAYLAGLHDSGWSGDPNLLRLSYLAMQAMFLGVAFPGVIARICADDMIPFVVQQFGRSRDEVASHWATVCEFALGNADEARVLMDRLGF